MRRPPPDPRPPTQARRLQWQSGFALARMRLRSLHPHGLGREAPAVLQPAANARLAAENLSRGCCPAPPSENWSRDCCPGQLMEPMATAGCQQRPMVGGIQNSVVRPPWWKLAVCCQIEVPKSRCLTNIVGQQRQVQIGQAHWHSASVKKSMELNGQGSGRPRLRLRAGPATGLDRIVQSEDVSSRC